MWEGEIRRGGKVGEERRGKGEEKGEEKRGE